MDPTNLVRIKLIIAGKDLNVIQSFYKVKCLPGHYFALKIFHIKKKPLDHKESSELHVHGTLLSAQPSLLIYING